MYSAESRRALLCCAWAVNAKLGLHLPPELLAIVAEFRVNFGTALRTCQQHTDVVTSIACWHDKVRSLCAYALCLGSAGVCGGALGTGGV